MEFEGSFELDGPSAETVWLALSDPVLVPVADRVVERFFENTRAELDQFGTIVTDAESNRDSSLTTGIKNRSGI